MIHLAVSASRPMTGFFMLALWRGFLPTRGPRRTSKIMLPRRLRSEVTCATPQFRQVVCGAIRGTISTGCPNRPKGSRDARRIIAIARRQGKTCFLNVVYVSQAR